MRALAEEAQHQGGLEDTVILQFPSFYELYPGTPSSFSSTSLIDNNTHVPVPLKNPALILHSSGEFFLPSAFM